MQLNVGLPLAGMPVFRMKSARRQAPALHSLPDLASLLVSTLLKHRYGLERSRVLERWDETERGSGTLGRNPSSKPLRNFHRELSPAHVKGARLISVLLVHQRGLLVEDVVDAAAD